ncbi:hypothetical protein [Flyfo siphovirus Tbat2_3]|nr:hypothetical protein [Flyfo siphovirus Tbat2_3]
MTNQLEALIAEMKAAAEHFGRLRELMWEQPPDFDYGEYAKALAQYSVNAASVENVLTLITALEQSQAKSVEQGLNACELFDEVTNLRGRIAEIESEKLETANVLLDAGKRIAELESDNSALRHVRAELSREANDLESKLEANQLSVKLPPHKFSECVNGLLEEAIAYAGTQQLRARLASRLSNFVKPGHAANGTVQGG